jgi:hypothetical protein
MKKEITVGGKQIIVTNETSQNFEGTVIITDPCYFINDEIWQALCSEVWFNNGKGTDFTDVGTIYMGSIKILYSSTAHGDGCYTVTECEGIIQNEFGVDAGMMAVISKEDFERLSNDPLTVGLYAVVEDFDGTIEASQDGNFNGDLCVFTDGTGDSDEDSWIDEDEDDDDSWRTEDLKGELGEDDYYYSDDDY